MKLKTVRDVLLVASGAFLVVLLWDFRLGLALWVLLTIGWGLFLWKTKK